MVNINIPIDDDIHRQLKLSAIAEQRTLKDYIIACLDGKIKADPLLRERRAQSRGSVPRPARDALAREGAP